MSVSQRIERQFFIHLIQLVNEIQQGKITLPSQFYSNRKSTWMKKVSDPRRNKDAFSRI